MTSAGLDSNGRPIRNLSARQSEAIEWLAAGWTPDEAAILIDVPPSMIARWLRTDLMFRRTLMARRADPRPPEVDPMRVLLRRLRPGEPEQPWSEE
jgi:hypothetical protein